MCVRACACYDCVGACARDSRTAQRVKMHGTGRAQASSLQKVITHRSRHVGSSTMWCEKINVENHEHMFWGGKKKTSTHGVFIFSSFLVDMVILCHVTTC